MSGTSLSPSSSKKRHYFQPPIKLTTNGSSSLSSPALASKRAAQRLSSNSRDASVATPNADDELTAKRKESTLRVLNIWDSLEKRYARPLEQDDIVDLETMRIVHDRGALRSMPQRTFGTVHHPEHTNGAESSGGEDEDDEQDPDDDNDELNRWEVDDFEEVNRLRPQPRQLTIHDENDLEEFLYADEQRKAVLGDPDEDLRQSSVESQSSFRPTPSVEQEQEEEEDEGSATDDLDSVLPRKRVQFKSPSATPGTGEHGRHDEEDEEEEEEGYVHRRRQAIAEDDGSSSDDPLAVAPADDAPRYPSSESETVPPHPRNVSRARSSSPKTPTPARPKANTQLFTPRLSGTPSRPDVRSESVRSLSRRPEAEARSWPGPYHNGIIGPSRLLERDQIREWKEESIPLPSQSSPHKRKRGQSPLPTPTPDPSYSPSSRYRSTPYYVERQGSPQQGHAKRARYHEYEYDRLPLREELHDNHPVPSPSPTRVLYRHLGYRDEPPSPPREDRYGRTPSRAPTATPRQISEMMFHLKKVNEFVWHHGLEDDLYSAEPERAFIPSPLSRHPNLPRQQRSQPNLRSCLREESVTESPPSFVTPRRPGVTSGSLYEPSSSSPMYSDVMLPPDTPSTLRGDSPVKASSSGRRREQVTAPSSFEKVVRVCIYS